MTPIEQSEKWHLGLQSSQALTLERCLEQMDSFKLEPKDGPFIVKLVENPKYDFGLFAGNVDLFTHDCIHILLGRGLLVKDEAFVIGFTMGSTKKLTKFKQWLFLLITKYLYPSGYRFQNEEANIFKTASLLARRMNCEDLSKIEFENLLEDNLKKVRKKLKINTKQLRIAYAVEKITYEKSPESQRLL